MWPQRSPHVSLECYPTLLWLLHTWAGELFLSGVLAVPGWGLPAWRCRDDDASAMLKLLEVKLPMASQLLTSLFDHYGDWDDGGWTNQEWRME